MDKNEEHQYAHQLQFTLREIIHSWSTHNLLNNYFLQMAYTLQYNGVSHIYVYFLDVQ